VSQQVEDEYNDLLAKAYYAVEAVFEHEEFQRAFGWQAGGDETQKRTWQASDLQTPDGARDA
jgi:hypothetical protein